MLLLIEANYTGGITSKRVTSGGCISTLSAWTNTAPKKHCSGGEPLAALCRIGPARASNPRSLEPIAMSLTTTQTRQFSDKSIVLL